MKNKKKILAVVLLLMILLTGCTKQLKDANGKIIRDDKTKQVLVENVLCQPIELKDEYKKALNQKKKDYKKLYEDGDLSKKDYTKKINSKLI